ncbi:MAG: hypothetical protein IJS74_04050 [Clostridia bacterium]|nr:hypothetical protein [Clostridia bacterium]
MFTFNTSLLSTAIISLFMLAIILGFIFGWIRGFSKSLVRFFMVLGMAVLAFFVVPALTNAILKADISNWNININGIQVITLEDLLGDLLRKIPVVEDLIHASPTLEAFIKFLPFMIANVVLFVVFFFAFKYVSLIIYWIIAGVCFSKKKMEGKDKHKFIGAVIGAVQGLLIACVCFVPVFGIVDTAQPVIQAAIAENAAAEEEAEGAPETVAYDVYYAEEEHDETEETENNNKMIERVEKAATEVDKYTSAFNNTWIIKVLNSVGVKKLSVSMFDKLTTISSGNITYSIRSEVKSVANVVPQFKEILESGFDMEDNKCIEKIQNAANKLCDDEVFGNIIKEVVPYASDKWFNNEKFCNIRKPNISNVAVAKLFDSMLLKLSTDEGKNVQNDMNVSFDILKMCNDADLIKTMNDGGDMMDVFTAEENKNLIADIIGKALESNTLKAVMPDLVNVGLDVIYKAIDESATPAKVTIVAENIIWDQTTDEGGNVNIGEKKRIQTIFTNLIKIFADVKDAEDPLAVLDFELMGETFDLLRDSQIFKDGKKGEVVITSVSKDLIETLFDSTLLGEDTTRLEGFKNALLNVWDNPDVSLKETFVALKDAIELARSLEDLNNLNLDNLGDIVETLANNDVLKDVVTEIIGDTETLTEMGIPENVAAVVSDTLTNVINQDYEEGELAKEVEALVEVYDIASQVLSVEDGEKVDITAEDANKLVDSLASSSVILDLITEANQDEENTTYSDLGIADSLSDETKTAIENALQANQDLTETDEGYENKLTEDQLAALKALFGITNEEAGE